MTMIDLFNADAYPASKAAFHCLYFSPNLTTTTSLSFIDFLVLIELIFAPFLSFQKFFSSAPKISTPQSSDEEWSVTGY